MKRWALRITVFLLLGAIVNVAVAWGLALRPFERSIEFRSVIIRRPSDPAALEVSIRSGAASTRVEAGSTRRLNVPPLPVLPSWSQASAVTDEQVQRGIEMLEEARGWPSLTLYWRRVDAPPAPRGFHGGIPINDASHRALPVIPIWPGFAINTLFYAAVLWLLFAGPFVLRRRRRIKRGLCPKCAYDLRGSKDTKACPECGAAVPLGQRTRQVYRRAPRPE